MIFWNKGTGIVGPSQAAVFMNIMPLVGIVCGVLFLDEHFLAAQAVGGVLILSGVYLTTQYRTVAYRLANILRVASVNDSRYADISMMSDLSTNRSNISHSQASSARVCNGGEPFYFSRYYVIPDFIDTGCEQCYAKMFTAYVANS